MILPTSVVNGVARGTITQVRRPATSRKKLKVGHDYPLSPAHGQPASCRIRIVRERTEPNGDAELGDVKLEGHGNLDAFKQRWVGWHDTAWLEALNGTAPPEALKQAVHRFDARHAHRLVDVITLVVVHDAPRFLAILDGHGDYTRSPTRSIDPDAECVDEATQHRYTQQAQDFGEQQRASFATDLEQARREQRARSEAKRRPMRRNG